MTITNAVEDEAGDDPALLATLGKTPEAAELERILALAGEPRTNQRLLPAVERSNGFPVEQSAQLRRELTAVVGQEFHKIRSEIAGIARAVQDNTAVLKLADVPLEHVADSHERASASFETLRVEIAAIDIRMTGIEKALAEVLGALQRVPGVSQ